MSKFLKFSRNTHTHTHTDTDTDGHRQTHTQTDRQTAGFWKRSGASKLVGGIATDKITAIGSGSAEAEARKQNI